MVLDKNIKPFIIYILFLNLGLILLYLFKKTQLILLLTKKVEILIEYLDFSNMFLKKNF